MKVTGLSINDYFKSVQNCHLLKFDPVNPELYWLMENLYKTIEESDGNTLLNIRSSSFAIKKNIIPTTIKNLLLIINQEQQIEKGTIYTKSQLFEKLNFEYEELSKIKQESNKEYLLNNWQEFLENVIKDKDWTSSTKENIIESIISDYEVWIADFTTQWNQYNLASIQQENFEQINLRPPGQLLLGFGLIKRENSELLYPLFTLPLIEISTMDLENQQFEFGNEFLTVNNIIDHLLFTEIEAAKLIKSQINEMQVSPFDTGLITQIYEQVVRHLHPDGKVTTCTETFEITEIPTILDCTYIFIKEENQISKENLWNEVTTDEVINNFIEKKPEEPKYSPIETLETAILNEPVITLLTQKSLFNKAIHEIIQNCQKHNLRALLVGESSTQFDELNERFIIDSTKTADTTYLASKLNRLSESQQAHHKEKNLAFYQEKYRIISEERQELMSEILEYKKNMQDKIFWRDKLYAPHELAQLISKLGIKKDLHKDLIPLDAVFPFDDDELKIIWNDRTFFDEKNVELLEHDFLAVEKVMDTPNFKTLEQLEATFHFMMSKQPNGFELFGADTQLSFIQFLIDKLPIIIEQVQSINNEVGFKILSTVIKSVNKLEEFALIIKNFSVKLHQTSKELDERFMDELNDLLMIPFVDVPDSFEGRLSYYLEKISEIEHVLAVATAILNFEQEAMTYSSTFKKVHEYGVHMLDYLLEAASLHAIKIEMDSHFQKIKSLLTVYDDSGFLHPTFKNMLTFLRNNQIGEFLVIAKECRELVIKRTKFLNFANFIETIKEIMPLFTSNLLSASLPNVLPNFKEVFDQGKLRSFLKLIETDYFENLIIDFEKVNIEYIKIDKIITSLELEPAVITIHDNNNIHPLGIDRFPAVFSSSLDCDLSLIDVVILLNAKKRNLYDLSFFENNKKVILVATDDESLENPIILNPSDMKKLTNRYGRKFQNLNDNLAYSLYDYVSKILPIEANFKLVQKFSVDSILQLADTRLASRDSRIQEDLLETFIKLGYNVKHQINLENLELDFLITDEFFALGIIFIGGDSFDYQFQFDQLSLASMFMQEGLTILHVVVPIYYLNPRAMITSICNKLEYLRSSAIL